ncbi:ABC transporter ATP-binding protein [Cohnella lubricantis]|uniref:ABC transporter ATP-binding protein n=1 Tax=Cohnella lubricantis TaxID=2163172 RepID=A0A841TB01_9BACL|nr:ABC transporter ATP-binding protein [Cohnella lubricantis]MBB6676568.1 ABC transporter ATP-binding protein [Cohnella lubricantis]MBP2117421.1 ATP-binding cassette subfamily B protein [Cohnella lubricantis]
MDVFRGLRAFFWQDKGFLLGSVLGLAAATALGLVYPMLLRILIDDMIVPGEYGGLLGLALLAVGIVVLKAGCQYVHGFCGGRLGNRTATRLRMTSYEKLQVLPFSFYDTARTGDLMSRLTADIEGIRNFIGFGFAQLLNTGFLVLFGFTMMAMIDWQLMLMTLVVIPVLAFVAIRFELNIHPVFRSIRVAVGRLTVSVQENISGVRTVKSFPSEQHEMKKFRSGNENYRDNNLNLAAGWAKYFPIIEFIANLSIVLLLLAGGLRVINGSLTLGALVSLNAMLGMIVAPLWTLGFQINNYTQSKAGGERLLELLHQPVTIHSDQDAIVLDDSQVRGHVQYDRVSFRYPNHEHQPSALIGFNLDAKPGSVIGMLGGTGSGKSTVVQLLLRAYDVSEGAIKLDGIDIRSLELESLRRQIAVVFQETFLFSTTIHENIAYGCADASMGDVVEAAKLAQAHDFIMELPDGYETIIGERGMGLSGGQKQRIAIARALLLKPKVLILDDSTSALDMETEHAIQRSLRQVMAGRTTFIIAHRISSLRQADEIVVLEKGRVVQRGKHDQLIRQPGLYRETYQTQYADRPDDLDSASDCERQVIG